MGIVNDDLLAAAKEVLANWERGDLAAAVRQLNAAVNVVQAESVETPKQRYAVALKEMVFYRVEVEAENEDEAGEVAIETWVQSSNPFNDFAGAGEGVEVLDVEVIGSDP
jgi:hypothetical protein